MPFTSSALKFAISIGAASIALGFFLTESIGKDRILVLAGGSTASSNQASLERNVHFFRKVAAETIPGTAVTEFFSSGNLDIRSVQFKPRNAKVPPANETMARLFGSTTNLKLTYRRHDLGEVDGTTSRANLESWFAKEGSSMKAGDRLVIYVTAHGGKSRDRKKPNNTTIYLWNRQSIDVVTLQKNLMKLPRGVSVVLIMAQCHSGGFAHSIFRETDPASGDFDAKVCGFFATLHSRQASGCTPDINEENYDEYSSHFWATLRGKDRLDRSVESADYDGDGRVSFDEAHAYTILVSKNIDIPIRTSDAFLRARVKFGDDEDVDDKRLLDRRLPYSEVIELAGPVDRAVLEGLSRRLGLSGEDRYTAAEKGAADVEKKRGELATEIKTIRGTRDGHRNAIRTTLLGRWPGLTNVLTEESVQLLTDKAGDFVAAVEQHDRFEAWNRADEERKKLEEERFQLQKEWAPYVRFMRAHDSVVLAENLERTGSERNRTRYARLREAEKETLQFPGPE